MITTKTIKYIIISLLVICFINFIVFIISFDKSNNNQIKENNKEEIILDDIPDNIQLANSVGNSRIKEKYAFVAQAEELRLIRFELQSLNSNIVELLNKK